MLPHPTRVLELWSVRALCAPRTNCFSLRGGLQRARSFFFGPCAPRLRIALGTEVGCSVQPEERLSGLCACAPSFSLLLGSCPFVSRNITLRALMCQRAPSIARAHLRSDAGEAALRSYHTHTYFFGISFFLRVRGSPRAFLCSCGCYPGKVVCKLPRVSVVGLVAAVAARWPMVLAARARVRARARTRVRSFEGLVHKAACSPASFGWPGSLEPDGSRSAWTEE